MDSRVDLASEVVELRERVLALEMKMAARPRYAVLEDPIVAAGLARIEAFEEKRRARLEAEAANPNRRRKIE